MTLKFNMFKKKKSPYAISKSKMGSNTEVLYSKGKSLYTKSAVTGRHAKYKGTTKRRMKSGW